jgi:hypothetical protein
MSAEGHDDNHFVSNFSKLVGELLGGLACVFDDCPKTQMALKAYQDNVRGNTRVELRIVQNWHTTMSTYYQYLLDHGVEAFVPVIDDIVKKQPSHSRPPTMTEAVMQYAKIAMMGGDETEKTRQKQELLEKIFQPVFLIVSLDLRGKWTDPDLDHESRENLMIYIMHMNALAIFHTIVPSELIEAAQKKGINMFDRIRGEDMEMNGASINQLGTEILENMPPEHMQTFLTNLDKFVLALRMLNRSADASTLFNNLLGPLTGLDPNAVQNHPQAQMMQQMMGLLQNVPPEAVDEAMSMLQNIPPGTIETFMAQIRNGEGAGIPADMDLNSILQTITGGGGGSQPDAPANPWQHDTGSMNSMMQQVLTNLQKNSSSRSQRK